MRRLVIAAVWVLLLLRGEKAEARTYPLYHNTDALPVITAGVRGGMHFQYISGNTLWNRQYDEGPVGGLYVSIHQRMIGGRIEANLRQTSYRNTSNNAGVDIINLDIPLLFEFRPVHFLKLHAGGQLTTFPQVEDSRHNDTRRNFKSVDCAVVLGVEGELPLNLIVGVRGTKGLFNVNDSGLPGTWTTTGAQVYIGYHLPTN